MGNSIRHRQTQEENYTNRSINIVEAAVLGKIQDFESMYVICTEIFELTMLEDKIRILKEMLDFTRDLKMEDMSRLKYFMADLVELAQDVMDIDIYSFLQILKVEKLEDEIKMTKMRMINFGAVEKNIGDEKEEEEVVVGLEEHVKNFVKSVILKNSHDLQIMSIKGMIGIGKTTLARQLYKAGAGQFQRHAWQMVVGYAERKPSLEEMDNRSLQQMLVWYLREFSYFIVLDNMPNEMGLKSILQGLPSEGIYLHPFCSS
ncbi:disease resistance protein RPP8-like isoform X2 [Salvia hispanica]|uniref:disease resistance protein RPP8-like isoform X2 n=1 Tax=Salvia hispanica TaxID=49212 RepID=UPI0020096A92|nr:disease resistance protein RPP8-like isoform X2 [Salvia hispanica]